MVRIVQDIVEIGLDLCVYVAQVADTASPPASCLDLPGVPNYQGTDDKDFLAHDA
jgi:hypothetical protein